mgnify:CR=1 FL=1
MAARETVIGKFINQIGFRIDRSTVQQVKSTVESVKSGIKTIQSVADEVKKSVNDNIDEIQKKAQKARSETEKLPEFKPDQKSTQNAKSAIRYGHSRWMGVRNAPQKRFWPARCA